MLTSSMEPGARHRTVDRDATVPLRSLPHRSLVVTAARTAACALGTRP